MAAVDLHDNRRAHAMQIMKNAQAWQDMAQEFELIAPGRWSRPPLDPQRLAAFYGLTRPLPVVSYPLAALERHPWPWLNTLFYRLAARRAARRKVNLIYTRSYAMAGQAIARGLPTVVETHGPPDDDPRKAELYRHLHHPLLRALVTISQPLKERYLAHGLPEAKILVTPDGVDLERFAQPLSLREARQHLGLNQERPLAVYSGHLYAGRGVETILAAARLLPGVDFLFVGGFDADVARYRALAGDIPNVRFTGFVDNALLPPWLWAADCLLMPYGRDCPTMAWMSPLKMFEYLAAGRPLIASDLPVLGEVLRQHDNALLVAVDDAQALAAGVRWVCEHPDAARDLGRRAAACAPDYGWDRRVRRILDFIGVTWAQ
ncbi:MAG: glycosyltransferase [Magnetococcus sp. WYHC-3]